MKIDAAVTTYVVLLKQWTVASPLPDSGLAYEFIDVKGDFVEAVEAAEQRLGVNSLPTFRWNTGAGPDGRRNDGDWCEVDIPGAINQAVHITVRVL